MTFAIRPARPGDEATILNLLIELATFERAPEAVQATQASLARTLFGPRPEAEALLAELGGAVVGVAVWFQSYSTWTGKPGLYLEDLFVSEAARGAGVGKALLVELARICRDRDYGRMEWSVLDWNTPAIRFYDSLGAGAKDGWIVRRLDGDALARLAS
jgi:GNAT superfamily N-acetyltransferase